MKKKLAGLLIMCFFVAGLGYSQEAKYQLSSHILDITSGKPAPDVVITLYKKDQDNKWIQVDERRTDRNGRVGDFLQQKNISNSGQYKLVFQTSPYFKSLGQKTFYPYIEVVFEITDDQHYHVPITVSPFGYSTYRGS
jgi:5-hydroxyisourate hydrolase